MLSKLKELESKLNLLISLVVELKHRQDVLYQQLSTLEKKTLGKLDALHLNQGSVPILDTLDILHLPKHLQDTYKALLSTERSKATAEMVAEITGKARAVESDYLNQLHTMGFVRKCREGRKVFFEIPSVNKDIYTMEEEE